MLTTLTEQDVRDVDFAQTTDRLAKTERCTIEQLLRSDARDYGYDRNDRNDPVIQEKYQEFVARYQRGKALLRDYFLLVSDRSIVGGRFSDSDMERIVSPIVQVSSGHIATAEARRALALVQR